MVDNYLDLSIIGASQDFVNILHHGGMGIHKHIYVRKHSNRNMACGRLLAHELSLTDVSI
jgi:hypothetical protein